MARCTQIGEFNGGSQSHGQSAAAILVCDTQKVPTAGFRAPYGGQEGINRRKISRRRKESIGGKSEVAGSLQPVGTLTVHDGLNSPLATFLKAEDFQKVSDSFALQIVAGSPLQLISVAFLLF